MLCIFIAVINYRVPVYQVPPVLYGPRSSVMVPLILHMVPYVIGMYEYSAYLYNLFNRELYGLEYCNSQASIRF